MKTFSAAILFVVVTISVALGNTLPTGKPYPEFQIGVTGLNAAIEEGVLAITQITPDTPAEGRLKAGDVLLTVNSTSLEIQDPRHALGEAINEAEGRDGRMVFTVSRDSEEVDVTIQLNPIGSYSKTWPMNCQKSQRIVDDAAAFIIKQGGPETGITGYCEGLFLLSTGEDKYLSILRKFAHSVSPGKVGSHTWYNGYHGVFLGEYYLRTGDTQVLPTLKALCDDAKERQYYGGWNHWDKPGPGYVTGGLMNPAGVQVLTTLILARECGVEVDEGTYDRALTLFYRFAGHGAVPYGDHHPTMYLGDNGKNGMLACALTLLPDKKFKDAAKVLALDEVDSYTMHEQGHGSAFGNQMWRGIAGVLVTDTMMANYRRHMDKLIWYYELCRMPGGGFKTPPMPGSGQRSIGKAPHYETGLISLAYTSHLRNLRITGKPRTKHSVKHRPTDVERNLPYTDSRKPGFVKGGSDLGLEPHEIYATFSKTYGGWWNTPPAELMSVQWYATMMRHYNPIVRSCAAHALGYLGEPGMPEILKALKSPDERLRVAGMEAISGLCFWGPNFTKVKITPDMIRELFLPYILKPLKNPGASMWEKRHALYVLSRADNNTIAAQTEIITPYLGDKEWYLRVAACTVIRPLIQETALIQPFLSGMFAHLDVDTNLPSRRWGATTIVKEILAKNDDLRVEVMARMAQSVNGTKVRDGYKQDIDVNNLFETMRYIAMQKHPEHVIPILPAIERIFPLTSGQHGNWVFTGARWGNIGLVKAAAALGQDAGPIIASMKVMLPEIKRRSLEGRDAKTFQAVLVAVKGAIEDYETKYAFMMADCTAKEKRAPNIVIILADDLGCGDMSLYDGWIKTPRIDRMAAEGVRFTDFHSNSSVCSPTRAALLTGRYQQRVGIIDVIAGHLDTPGLEATELTIPRLMKQNGYRTALFGKWHLGPEPRHNPIHHGFDEFVGFLPGGSDYLNHRNWRDGLEVKDQKGYGTHIITDKSVDFIKRNKDNPFFLYVSHQAVHNYYQIPSDPPGTRGRDIPLSGKEAQARYKIMLKDLDRGVGIVLDTLKKLDLDEKTLVIFLSDNGDVRMNPNVRPYRGGKFSNYEGGHRVPAAARWPGYIRAGWTSDELTVGMDLLPTIMDIIGIDLPQQRTFDGISLKDHLLKRADLPDRRVFFGYEPKLGTAMRDGHWKMQTKGDVIELYDLSQDIKETTNMAAKYPERTKAMKAAIDTWKQEVTAQTGGG